MRQQFLFILLLSVSAFAEDIFEIPDRIKNDVDFWAKVYREWDTHQVVFYDSKTKVVYDVLDLPVVNNDLSAAKFRKEVDARYKLIESALSQPEDADPKGLTATLKANGLLGEPDLKGRLKVQSGLRKQFEYGLRSSGRYIDDMKAILKAQDLPEDLLAIVFVESLFNLSAVSHAGASGPWGIMRETAIRSGIHVNNFTDERRDWVVATWGAAQFLKRAKEGLTEWPLAITAYNYGYAGMMRAVNNLGKDFEAILDNHTSPIFGYASKSYYAEFLAARDTIQNQDKYFPNLKKDARCRYDTVEVQRPVEVLDLMSLGVFKKDDLKSLNPALTERTVNGHEVLPANYALRIPHGKSGVFYQQIKKIDAKKRNKASAKVSTKHKARPNETLLSIARKFGIFEEYLSKKMNKPLDYKPKGTVLIRSESHKFLPLTELNQNILSNLSPGQTLEKPAEIRATKK